MLSLGKVTHKRGEDLRRFDTHQHRFYGGIDLHARTMYVCILSHDGALLVHRNLPAAPEPFLSAVTPYREGLVGAVACMFTWSWLAALGAAQHLPFVLGHALSLQAIHGGKANNDQSDAHKLAALLRGGMLPQASVSPAEMRATRDLVRRRPPLMRQRAELLAPVHNTNAPDHVPDIGKKIAYKANREGAAARLNDPSVHKTLAGDLALITYDDELLRDVELSMVHTAKQHEAHTRSVLQTVPGLGTILSRVLRSDIHAIGRFPRVQDCAASARLVKCRKESAGQR